MVLIPPRVACLSQKGGGGKTTMATNLAVAAALAGAPTLLLDLDPQQSSVRAWANWRAARKPRPRAPVTAQAVGWDNLEATLLAAEKSKHKLIVLDTPGQKGNVSNYARCRWVGVCWTCMFQRTAGKLGLSQRNRLCRSLRLDSDRRAQRRAFPVSV